MKILKLFFIVTFLGNALHAADENRSFENKYRLTICRDKDGNDLPLHIIEPDAYYPHNDGYTRSYITQKYTVVSPDRWIKDEDERDYYNTVIQPEISFLSRAKNNVIFEKHGYLATGEYLILVSIKDDRYYFFEIRIPKYSIAEKECFPKKSAAIYLVTYEQIFGSAKPLEDYNRSDLLQINFKTFRSEVQGIKIDGGDLLGLVLKIKEAIMKETLNN
jgi:hypothetical protein